jgi:predicted DNA-binding transcriptional regulator AlpA
MSHESAGDDKSRFISLAEAAELYGFSQVHLAQLCQRGRLKAQKIGNSWATTPADVEKYIQSRQKRGAYRDDIQLD